MTDGHRGTVSTHDPLQRVRGICLALPDTVERVSHGAPAWWVRGARSFALFADRHRDDRFGVWCASDEDTQHELIRFDPQRFYRPPYLGWRGWVGIDLEVTPEWVEIENLLTAAHDRVAKR